MEDLEDKLIGDFILDVFGDGKGDSVFGLDELMGDGNDGLIASGGDVEYYTNLIDELIGDELIGDIDDGLIASAKLKHSSNLLFSLDDLDDRLNDSYGDGECFTRGEVLGKGSFGSVFLANAKAAGYPPVMAVKSAMVHSAETLRLERRVLNHLACCSSIIQCFGSEITHKRNGIGIYNLLLEYASGGTLKDRIQSKGLPELEVRRYTKSLVEGLLRIHREGFVHCDLKPGNILLCPTAIEGELQAKICDFGLAKGVKEDRQRKRLDRAWQGTPWYLAPEAVREAVQETPTDIWSLGIIVLEMLTGRPAWDLEKGSGTEAKKVIQQLQKGCIPKLPENLSPKAKSFLRSCLRRMPKNRGTAKWLLRHPFISGIRVGPRSRPEAAGMDLTRSCIQSVQRSNSNPFCIDIL